MKLVPESRRLDIFPEYLKHPLLITRFEDYLYSFATDMVDGYNGGYWEMYEIPNGFFMMPGSDEAIKLTVTSSNTYKATVPAIDAGSVLTVFTVSNLSFYAYEKKYGDLSPLYFAVREAIFDSPNSEQLIKLID